MLILNSYEAEKDAARAKTPSKTPLVSEIQTSTVQQIIEKTVNRSAGMMAMQSDLMQPEAAASQAPVSAPAAPKAAAPEQKPALSGHNSGSGCEDEQRKPLSAKLPTTAPALPKDATPAATDARRICRRFRQHHCQSASAH